MEAYQERVIVERNELQEKLEKLITFLSSTTFSNLNVDEKARLTKQAEFMQGYLDILNTRIAFFK